MAGLDRLFEPVLEELEQEKERNLRQSFFWWGFVSSLGPLRVRREGESVPLDVRPSSLVADLVVGDRVFVLNHARKLIVLGRASAPQ